MPMSRPGRPFAASAVRRNRGGQVAVLDMGLGAALGVAALATLFTVYFVLRQTASTVDDYGVIVSVVHEVEASVLRHPSYDGIDTAYVIARGHLPPRVVSAGRILLASDGVLTVTPGASPAASFALSATGVALSRCVKLSLTPIDDRQQGISINGVAVGVSPTVAAVEAACRRADPGNIVWTLG